MSWLEWVVGLLLLSILLPVVVVLWLHLLTPLVRSLCQ